MDMGTALVVAAAIGAYYQIRSQRIRAGLDKGPLLGFGRSRDADGSGAIPTAPAKPSWKGSRCIARTP